MSRIRREFWDPDGDRYGIPTYWWRGAPDGYATRRQLRAAGLRPAGQPVAAQILWRGVGGIRQANLYRVDQAQPKREATPAQRAAIGKALTARRTCPTCEQERDYYIPQSLGECLDCAPDLSPVPARTTDTEPARDATSEAMAKLQRAAEAVATRRHTNQLADARGEPATARRERTAPSLEVAGS